MLIEITSLDVEALIRQRMEAGFFKTPEDLIREVLRSAPEGNRSRRTRQRSAAMLRAGKVSS